MTLTGGTFGGVGKFQECFRSQPSQGRVKPKPSWMLALGGQPCRGVGLLSFQQTAVFEVLNSTALEILDIMMFGCCEKVAISDVSLRPKNS